MRIFGSSSHDFVKLDVGLTQTIATYTNATQYFPTALYNSILVEAGGGNDIVYGENGNDRLIGGDGRDYIVGGVGIDLMRGETGVDQILARTGEDDFRGNSGDLITLV